MRIVLVRLSALGDIVHTWPLAVAIRAARPDAHLAWVVEERLRPMVDGHPAVDSVLTVNTRRWRRSPLGAATRAAIAILRSRFQELQPDLTIDPQGVLKSAFVTRLTRAPRRVGLARPWRRELAAGLAYTETMAGSLAERHVVATNVALVRAVGGEPPVGVPLPDGRWLVERLAGSRPPVPPEPAYAVLLAGAGWSDKLLPVDCLAAVARHTAAAGIKAVVLWGPGEQPRAERVVESCRGCAELAPETDLAGLVQTLAGARAVIGGDTGPVHLAASLGVPTLAAFTSTSRSRNGPLGRRVEVVSGADDSHRGPTASARAARSGPVRAQDLTAALHRLLDGG